MQRFKNILLVTSDPSQPDAAFTRALQLARQNEARLTIVSVVDSLPSTTRWLPALSLEELEEVAIDTRYELLEQLITPLQERGQDVSVRVLCGIPFLEIIQQVLRAEHDLVVIGTDQEEQERHQFGSTTLHLLRKSPCPVWVVPLDRPPRYARILAVVDMKQGLEESQRVNQTVLELATSLAAMDDSELHIVHPWSLYGEEALWGRRLRLPPEEVRLIVEEARSLRLAWLDDLLEEQNLGSVRHHVHLIKGESARVVTQLAADLRAEVMVLGTVERSDIPGLLISDTAEEILRSADCSVIGVKPPGFKSPVKRPAWEAIIGS